LKTDISRTLLSIELKLLCLIAVLVLQDRICVTIETKVFSSERLNHFELCELAFGLVYSMYDRYVT